MKSTTTLPTLSIVVTLALAASQAVAQTTETREQELQAKRAEKAQQMEPARLSRVERVLLSLENDRLLERLLNPPEGFYPRVGHVTPGSSFSLGVGYRRPRLLGERAVLSASAMGSLKKYWVAEARLLMPRLADDTAQVEVYAQRFSWPEEAFFGLGPDSLRRSQANFSLENTLVGGSGALRAGRLLSLGGRVEHMLPRAGRGQAAGLPTIGDIFPTAQAPGLGDATSFGRFEAFADFNYREPVMNPRRGGRYYVSYAAYDDLDLDRYGFRRIEVDLQQYFPFLMDRRVFAFHALLSASDAGGGQEVPFYLMRSLGGPDDLRGFRRHRFRDRNILLLQAEYRWEVFTAVDAALFVDAGQVAPRVEDLSLGRLETDYGFGLRFGSVNGVFLRIEGAFGSRDGKHFIFRLGHVF
ncbi:MAG TPA: BamA/TamA family outer membrane protein [Vicinamibacterales bacterium]|nr:BamA/TamA family outer membrane protein [Vicinamibacterales bacterium]